MTPSGNEIALLERIDDALREAVGAANLDWSRATRIKRQKYANMAINRFSSDAEGAPAPVTRSWFMFGDTQPLSPPGTTRLDIEQPDSPSITNDSDQGKEGRSPYDDPIYDVNETEFMEFFLNEAYGPPLTKQYWNLSDLEFLEIYYGQHAPQELTNIYLSNLAIRQAITAARKSVEDIYEGRAQLYRDEPGSLPNLAETEYYDNVSEASVKLRLGMRNHPNLFNDSISIVKSYTDLVEDVLLRLQSIPRRNIVRPQSRLLQELEDFYDSVVWLIPASEMSAQTAEGPRAGALVSAAYENIENAEEIFEEEFPQLQKECESKELLPRPSDYPNRNDEASEIVDQMMGIVDRPTSDE